MENQNKTMFRIRRLYTFIYQTFLPILAMTFGICLFIFIIQFLWQQIDKLVGKGLDTSVILELFCYASLMLIPQALPLAILLASLMTFGNMGERLELLAIKASGVSLMHIMKPMIVLISLITFGSFMFQNKLTPMLSVKVYGLLYSIKMKTPELDIPEGAFYTSDGMKGYSIYVKKKDLETHMLHNVIIYDLSAGSGVNSVAVDVCDSAIIQKADDEGFFTLTMYDGERFQNQEKKRDNKTSGRSNQNDPTSYVRESFKRKQIVFPFDGGGLERIDDSRYDDSQLSKGLNSLQTSIDSMSKHVDSLNIIDRASVANMSTISYRKDKKYTDSLELITKQIEQIDIARIETLNFDSVFNSYSVKGRNEILNQASIEAKSRASQHLMYYHIDMPKPMIQKSVRLHKIYWHKIFSVPFACLVFFFIGAPLGSIIRKGGLGIPVVISVILFIIYYMLGSVGYKMARDGVWAAWQGEWLSAAVLFPLGVFLTYKSMNESALFNVEAYGNYIRRFLKIDSDTNWSPTKEVDLSEILPVNALNAESAQIKSFQELDNNTLKDIINNFKDYGFSGNDKHLALSILKERDTYFFDVRVNNYDYDYSQQLLSRFSKNSLRLAIPLYLLAIAGFVLSIFFSKSIWLAPSIVLAVAYFIAYIRSAMYMSDFYTSISKKDKVLAVLLKYLLLLLIHPIGYFIQHRRMNKLVEKIKNIRF